MGLPRIQGHLKELIFHLHMTVAAIMDDIMFTNVGLVDLLHRMALKTVFSTLSHGVRFRYMTLNTSQHRFMPFVFMDRRYQSGVARHTVPCTGQKGNGKIE